MTSRYLLFLSLRWCLPWLVLLIVMMRVILLEVIDLGFEFRVEMMILQWILSKALVLLDR